MNFSNAFGRKLPSFFPRKPFHWKKFAQRSIAIILLVTISLAVTVEIICRNIVRPSREKRSETAEEILHAPHKHGMTIATGLLSPEGLPYLSCKPSLKYKGNSKKGNLLRTQLLKRGVVLQNNNANDHFIILIHGHSSRGDALLPVAERFCAIGFTCLIPDLPGHGSHPAKQTWFGNREAPLILSLLEHAAKEKSTHEPRAALFGFSQGGAIALKAAAEYPDSFWAIGTLSTFSSLPRIMDEKASKLPGVSLLRPLVDWRLKQGYHFAPEAIQPWKDAQKISQPIFLLHGDKDKLAAAYHSEHLFQEVSHPNKNIRIVPNASHGNVLAKGHQVYADICEFYLNNI